jgi:hypothetical protein
MKRAALFPSPSRRGRHSSPHLQGEGGALPLTFKERAALFSLSFKERAGVRMVCSQAA